MEAPCKLGDRIRLTHMPDDPCPIPDGSTGTVNYLHQFMGLPRQQQDKWQIGVAWDCGRTLFLIWPVDQFTIIQEKKG